MSSDSHEHDYVRGVLDRLPAAIVRKLSRIEPSRALLAVASEWLGIAAGVAFYMWRRDLDLAAGRDLDRRAAHVR